MHSLMGFVLIPAVTSDLSPLLCLLVFGFYQPTAAVRLQAGRLSPTHRDTDIMLRC